jgi:serine/threonine protein kinase
VAISSALATESAGTAAGILLGTAGYMSPEQAIGGTVDYPSDQFTLGIILYERLREDAPSGGTRRRKRWPPWRRQSRSEPDPP